MTSDTVHPGRVLRWMMGDGPWSAPRFVWLLFSIAVGLGLAYLVDVALGRPGGSLSTAVDLDGEANVPTWFSSTQWFAAAAALFVVADRRFDSRIPRSWSLWALPAFALAFSVDEVVQAHEYAGALSDVLLPGGTRDSSVLPATGVFGIVIGVPSIVLFGAVLILSRPYLQTTSRAFPRIALGTVLFLVAAVGLDFLSNFVTPESPIAIVEVYLEETLEMFGATLILWGGYLALRVGPATTDP